MKHHFFIMTILLSLTSKIVFCQWVAPNNKYNNHDTIPTEVRTDKDFKIVLNLADTVPASCECGQIIGSKFKDTRDLYVYKFLADPIINGNYANKYIYVCYEKIDIKRYILQGSRPFCWHVYKTDKFCNDLPIYVMGGTF